MSSKREPPKFERRPNVSIPIRYRCKVGGEWKPIQAFSKNQQRLVESQIRFKGKVDAANSGMTCLEHSAGARSELRCDLCQLVKPLTEFSKSMRKTDDPMCKRCTAWTEIQEPGVVPPPLETGHITQEEEENMRNIKSMDFPADFFPADTLPQAPITSLSAMGIDEKTSAASSSGRSSVSDAGSLPPHLVETVISRGRSFEFPESGAGKGNSGSNWQALKEISDLLSGQGSCTSSASTASSKRVSGSGGRTESSVTTTDELPPHVQVLVKTSESRHAPFVGGFHGRDTFNKSPASISTATTVREGREGVSFNAWDNSGQRHEAIKVPTERSASSADSVGAYEDWTTVPDTKKRKGGWCKAPRYQPDQQTSYKTSAGLIDFGVDHQRRMNYCVTEDSD